MLRRLLKRVVSPSGIQPSGVVATRDAKAEFPFKGFPPSCARAGEVEKLSDGELQELNSILPWKCFTVDQHGRRFGAPARADKRNAPQAIPDYRTPMLDAEFSLSGKHVLEIGCFEGVHTTGLAMAGARVTAVDSRLENVVKTIVRTTFYGFPVQVLRCDIENPDDFVRLPKVDLIHHIGVLYHLKDPVSHLLRLGALAQQGLMLDTHVAQPHEASKSYTVDGRTFSYKHYSEGGHADVFAGMYDHAKWLTLDTLKSLLAEVGLKKVRVAESRDERNGPRVLIFAGR